MRHHLRGHPPAPLPFPHIHRTARGSRKVETNCALKNRSKIKYLICISPTEGKKHRAKNRVNLNTFGTFGNSVSFPARSDAVICSRTSTFKNVSGPYQIIR